MTTPSMTYQTLMTNAINLVKSSCTNVSGTIPSEYVSGYSNTRTTTGTGDRTCTVTLVTTIASGAVAAVDASTVESQMNSFFSDRGISSKASQNITTRGLANFYNNLAAFCSARILNYSSQMNSTNITVYNSGSVSYTSVNTVSENEVITASQDVTLAIQLMSTIITQNARGGAVRYSRTLSHSAIT